MKLTTARLKRLIKEELEAVMQEEQEEEMSDLQYNVKYIGNLMKYGMSDYKDLREKYPQSYDAAIKLADYADAETLDALQKGLGYKGNLMRDLGLHILQYIHGGGIERDEDAGLQAIQRLTPIIHKAMDKVKYYSRSFGGRMLSNLTGGFLEE